MTLDINKLKAVKTIVTHEFCSDGTASAMILKSVLPNANVLFMNYETPEQKNLPATPGMLFCDFSPHSSRVQEFVDAGAIVMDHHKGQKDTVAAFGANGVFADEVTNPGVSGALLAFQNVWMPLVQSEPTKYLQGTSRAVYDQLQNHLDFILSLVASNIAQTKGSPATQEEVEGHPEVMQTRANLSRIVTKGSTVQLIQDFATLVGIRDTWQTSNPLWSKSLENHESILFFPLEDWLTQPIFPSGGSSDTNWNMRISMGHYLVENATRHAKLALSGAYRGTTSNGLKVIIHQGLSSVSNVAELSGTGTDLIIGFGMFSDSLTDMANWPQKDTVGPKMVISCRTRTSFDLLSFVKAHGGGGHSKAGGFSVYLKPTDPNPYVFLLNLIQAYKS